MSIRGKKSKAERFVEVAAEQFRELIEKFNADGSVSYAIAGFLAYAPHKYYRGCPFIEIASANCETVKRKALLLGFNAHYAEKCTEVSTPELLVKIWSIPQFLFDECEVDFFGKPLRMRFLSKEDNATFVKNQWSLLGSLDAAKIASGEHVNCEGLSDRAAESELVTRYFETMGINTGHDHSNGAESCKLCRIRGDLCV